MMGHWWLTVGHDIDSECKLYHRDDGEIKTEIQRSSSAGREILKWNKNISRKKSKYRIVWSFN